MSKPTRKVLLVIGFDTVVVKELQKSMRLPYILWGLSKREISQDYPTYTLFHVPEEYFDLAKHLLDHLKIKYSSTF